MPQPPNRRYELFSQGIFVDPMVPIERLKLLVKKLRPRITDIELTRIGAPKDGGYLVPKDLTGINTCFSPGVDQTASFESDLQNLGIHSHLADYSVNGPPEEVQVKSFLKKFIGANNSETHITLQNWIKDTSDYPLNSDFILQMDIEGSEYEVLLSTPDNVLSRFRIVVIEFHNIETWSQRDFLGIVEATFDKLLNLFYVVHSHPNNAMGIVDLNGFSAPRVFELTLLRKDRVKVLGDYATLPHPLDRANIPGMPDLTFPVDWVS